jgi:hypothetical protein
VKRQSIGFNPKLRRNVLDAFENVRDSRPMDKSREYRVDEVHPGGWVKISEPLEGWVPIEGVAFFRSHDLTFRLRPRFNALVVDNVTTSDGYRTLGSLIATVGSSKIRRPSARDTFIT